MLRTTGHKGIGIPGLGLSMGVVVGLGDAYNVLSGLVCGIGLFIGPSWQGLGILNISFFILLKSDTEGRK